MQVYLVQQQNSKLYKIGVTSKPVLERISELQTGNPETLLLVNSFKTSYGFQLENLVHRKFASQNVQLEWFELTDEQANSFLDVCKVGEANLLLLKEENTYLQDRYTKKVRKNYWN